MNYRSRRIRRIDVNEEAKVVTREKKTRIFQKETYLDVKLSEPSSDWRKTSCIA